MELEGRLLVLDPSANYVDASINVRRETAYSTEDVSAVSPDGSRAVVAEVENLQDITGPEGTASRDTRDDPGRRQTRFEGGRSRDSEGEAARAGSREDDESMDDIKVQPQVQEPVEKEQSDEEDASGVVEAVHVNDVGTFEEEGEGYSEVVASQTDEGLGAVIGEALTLDEV